MEESYKGRITEKEDHWAFEYYDINSNTWCPLVINDTKEQLLEYIKTTIKDDEGLDKKDEDGNIITMIYPFWYEE